jgi:hypothetical protein
MEKKHLRLVTDQPKPPRRLHRSRPRLSDEHRARLGAAIVNLKRLWT